jgi:hypothetical protein
MASQRSTFWRLLLIWHLAALLLGCSDKYPVKGTVQFSDGTPLTGGMIIFEHEAGATSGYSGIGPDGSFEITYDDPQDGLPKGAYRIAVRPPSPSGMTAEQKKKMKPRGGIALKYLQPETSEITVQIDGERTDLVIELQPDDGTSRQPSGR